MLLSPVDIVVLVFGCCLGSFFNVVIYRLPKKESLVRPPSNCPACHARIAVYDNIPVLSYLILRGKCRHCGIRIAPRYPLVEALSGVLAVALYRAYGLTPAFAVLLVFVSLLIIVSFIDLDTFLIPDVLSLPGIVIGFATSIVNPHVGWLGSLFGIVLGGGLFYLVAWGYQVLRHQEGLGGGDIKLLAMIGAFIGWPGVVFTILVGSLAGAAVGIIAMSKGRQGMSTRIPFGPFLSLGAACYLFWGEAFFKWYLAWVGQ